MWTFFIFRGRVKLGQFTCRTLVFKMVSESFIFAQSSYCGEWTPPPPHSSEQIYATGFKCSWITNWFLVLYWERMWSVATITTVICSSVAQAQRKRLKRDGSASFVTSREWSVVAEAAWSVPNARPSCYKREQRSCIVSKAGLKTRAMWAAFTAHEVRFRRFYYVGATNMPLSIRSWGDCDTLWNLCALATEVLDMFKILWRPRRWWRSLTLQQRSHYDGEDLKWSSHDMSRFVDFWGS